MNDKYGIETHKDYALEKKRLEDTMAVVQEEIQLAEAERKKIREDTRQHL